MVIENLIIAFNCVLPVFIIICVGVLIRRSNKVPEQTFTHLSTISFNFLIPCSLFYSIYNADLSVAFDVKLLIYMVVFVLAIFLIGFVLFTIFMKDYRARGVFIQSIYRANIAVVGVSMATSLMGTDGAAALSVVMAVLVPIFNIMAVVTLETCRGGKVELKSTLLGIVKNPLIISCVLGIIFLLAKISLPTFALKAINQLGIAGSTLTLIALGASFKFAGVRKNLKRVIWATALRLIIVPILALTGAILLGFRGNAIGVVLLCSGASLATTSYPMAIAKGSDHELTAQVVVSTSLFCCVTLFLFILLLKELAFL